MHHTEECRVLLQLMGRCVCARILLYTRMSHMSHLGVSHVTHRIEAYHTCAALAHGLVREWMRQSCIRHDSFLRVTQFILTRDITNSIV